jgi:hypothetical protein
MRMSSARNRKKKFKWAPMLKGEGDRSATVQQTASAQSANAALGVIGSQARPPRRAAAPKQQVSAARVARRVAGSASPAGSSGSGAWGWAAVGAAAIGGVGACVLLATSLLQAAEHHVEGTVMFLQRPLPEAMLCFHAGTSAAPCMSTITGRDGRFSVDMPSGSYKVTVRSIGDADQGIPLVYGRVESTRFNLSIDRDMASVAMLIESK